MSHRKSHARQHDKGPHPTPPIAVRQQPSPNQPHLELVVKAESSGSLEAITDAIQTMNPSVPISIIHRGIGAVNKTDLLNASTGSRLIIGFEVDVQPHIESSCNEQNVEIRLYNVIYRLLDDLRELTASFAPAAVTEAVTGSAKVIALFKSCRHGIILGCEVLGGRLQVGDRFRVIAAMGPVYTGRVESLHIGDHAVRQASPGQQVGIKIKDFNGAHVNDLVEAFKAEKPTYRPPWQPSGKVFYP